MYIGCDFSMEECVRDFELLGYTHDEAIELGKLAVIGSPIQIDEEIIDELNKIGCTSFRLTPEEIERILKNESN